MAFTQPTPVKVNTTSPITWSDGSLFTGYLQLGLARPTDATGCQWSRIMYQGTSQRLPEWYVIPIIEGQLDQNTGIFPNNQVDPPGTLLAAYWFDNTWKQIYPFPVGVVPTMFTVPNTNNPYIISVPTLTVPTVADGSLTPVPQEENNDMIFAIPYEYFLGGTADGVNTVFTIPVVPKAFAALFIDGQKQDPNVYVRTGVTVTFNTAPTAGSSVTALVI